MDYKHEQDYQVVYDLLTGQDEVPEYSDKTLEEFKIRAELVFGPKGLNIATVKKCYFEERIYETLTKWVMVIDLHFQDFLKLADIKPDSLENDSIAYLIPLEELKAEKREDWDRLKE
jgi:hypothetical protein